MMKRKIFLIAGLLTLVFLNSMCTAFSYIENGSFEADGEISDITSQSPYMWDVNVPANFGGETWDAWKTDGDYSLKIYSSRNYTFTAGEEAKISQQIDLSDVKKIFFDIYLRGYYYGAYDWDGSKCTAFVKVDEDIVWQSEQSANGEYLDQIADVNSYTGTHTVSVGIRVDVNETLSASYWTMWDFIQLDAYCGGFGYLEGDLNSDCYVDFGDIEILGEKWLKSETGVVDIVWDGTINMADFAMLALDWLQCTDWQNEDCVEIPLDLDADLNLNGVVNFEDYRILISAWDINDVNAIEDIDGSGLVDYNDLKIMNQQWLLRSWLYGR